MWALESWKEARVEKSWFMEAQSRSNITSHPEIWILYMHKKNIHAIFHVCIIYTIAHA